MLILTIFVPRALNIPGGSQNADFKYFRASATKWLQEALRTLILSIFAPWPPNGPRRLQNVDFNRFHASANKWPKEAPRINF